MAGFHTRLESAISEQVKHLVSAFRLFATVAVVFVVVMIVICLIKFNEQSVGAEEPPPASASTSSYAATTGSGLEDGSAALEASGTSADTRAASDDDTLVGWQYLDGERYFYFADGRIATGTQIIKGVVFDFDDQGRWQSSYLNVPYISQLPDMPSGCEVVSVTMMLNQAGVRVSKEEVAERLPYASDPDLGFTGSLYVDGSSGASGVIWPPALLGLVKSLKGSAADLTGQPWETICSYIDEGKPVVVWFRSDGLDHTVLLTGYSRSQVWINDPLAEKDVVLDLTAFMDSWAGNGYRALSY
jgi:uncharacterized protein YvpB/Na+-transporting methylmalonyl-CoA/oxaloacetate decarboxylase gamma subunit